MKLLFVDDVRDTRDFFRFAFELENIQVRLAGDGSEAVEMVEKEDFDIIIMDVEMPQMNGWDAVERIRRLPRGANVPILMFTAHCDAESRRKSVETRANALLCKPVLPDEMLSRIEKIIKKSR